MTDILNPIADILEDAASIRKCPRCRGTGWWSQGTETGRGYTLTGGPCDHTLSRKQVPAEGVVSHG